MNDQLIKNWEKAKTAVKKAEEWNNLPYGKKYQNDRFAISLAHCKKPRFIRAGQQCHAGKNYWETDDEFGLAVLEYLINGWSDHYPQIIEILKKKESKALQECQAFVDKMQRLIDENEKAPTEKSQ